LPLKNTKKDTIFLKKVEKHILVGQGGRWGGGGRGPGGGRGSRLPSCPLLRTPMHFGEI